MLCTIKILLINKEFDLVLVQWYDYKSASKPNKYEYPWLILTTQYKFIPVEVGVEPVYIIQRFIKNNKYFVNYFIF